MIINSLLLEDERFNRALVHELAAALTRFLQFHNASGVEILRTKPKELDGMLLSELGLTTGVAHCGGKD